MSSESTTAELSGVTAATALTAAEPLQEQGGSDHGSDSPNKKAGCKKARWADAALQGEPVQRSGVSDLVRNLGIGERRALRKSVEEALEHSRSQRDGEAEPLMAPLGEGVEERSSEAAREGTLVGTCVRTKVPGFGMHEGIVSRAVDGKLLVKFDDGDERAYVSRSRLTDDLGEDDL